MSTNKHSSLSFSKHWYLGFLGFIGFYYLSDIGSLLQGEASLWALSHALWFLWFSYFIPQKAESNAPTA